MKMKGITKTLLASALTIALSLGMIGGATYALFTDKSEVNVAVTSGKVDVQATPEKLTLYSPTWIDYDTKEIVDRTNAAENGKFANGGTAKLEGGTLKLDKIAPGDRVNFDIKFANQSTIAAKYRVKMESLGDLALVTGLTISIAKNEEEAQSFTRIATYISEWRDLSVETEAIETLHVMVELASTQGNDYAGRECSLKFTIEAVQSNAKVTDESKLHGGESGTAYVEKLTPVFTGQQLREGVAAVAKGGSGAFVFGYDIETPYIDGRGGWYITNKNIELNLNNLTLKMSNQYGMFGYVECGSTVTVKNGTIEASSTGAKNNKFPMFGVYTAKSQMVDGKTYTDTLNMENVKVNFHNNADGSAFYMIGSNAEDAEHRSRTNVSLNNVDFTVTGLMHNAFYLPNPGTRNFTDVTVKGDQVVTSHFICAGDWTIKGGSYVGHPYADNQTAIFDPNQLYDRGSKKATVDGAFTNTNGTIDLTTYTNTTGSFGNGDAIFIAVRRSEGYVLGDITIEDVKFTVGTKQFYADTEIAGLASGTVTEGPAGYAIRLLDRTNWSHGTITVKNVKTVAIVDGKEVEVVLKETYKTDAGTATRDFMAFNGLGTPDANGTYTVAKREKTGA